MSSAMRVLVSLESATSAAETAATGSTTTSATSSRIEIGRRGGVARVEAGAGLVVILNKLDRPRAVTPTFGRSVHFAATLGSAALSSRGTPRDLDRRFAPEIPRSTTG